MTGQEFGEALDGPAATAVESRDRRDAADCADAPADDLRSTMTKVVALVEEHSFVRDCIQLGLEAVSGYLLLIYDSVAQFEGDPKRRTSGIIITTCFGVDNGALAAALAKLRDCEPDIPVLVLGPQKTDFVNVAIAHGAKGYIPFTTKFDVVVEVIRVILAGGTYAPLDCLPRGGAGGPGAGPAYPRDPFHKGLTARELAVVRAIQQGKSNKVIAYTLNMTESTVKVHVRHIMAKLKAKNRTEIAVMSDKMGVSLLDDHALN